MPWQITWRDGQFSKQDYENWLAYIELLDNESAIKEMVLVEHLSREAKREGMDREPHTKMAIETSVQRIYGDRLREYVFTQTQVDLSEVTRLREEYPDAFKKPRKMRLRQIYLHPGPNQSEEQMRAKLLELREKAQQGDSFEELAKNYSQSQSRFSGGRLGIVNLEDFPEPVFQALKDLEAGALSEVVATGRGWSLFLCEEVRQEENPSPAEVEAKILTNLRRQKSKREWQEMTQGLRALVELPTDLDFTADPIRIDGQELSQAEWLALLRLRFGETAVGDLDRQQMLELLSNWCLAKRIIAKGKELGFEAEAEFANKLHWVPLTYLAYEELNRRVASKVKPLSKEEIHEYFKTHQGKLFHPPEFQFRVIFFGEEQGDGAVVTLAEKVYSQIHQGTLSFADAAKTYSLDPSAAEGGLWPMLGLRNLSGFSTTFAKAARQLVPGEQSGVLRLESGIWLLEMVAKNPKRPMSLEDAEELIKVQGLERQRKTLEINTRRAIQDSLQITIPSADTDS